MDLPKYSEENVRVQDSPKMDNNLSLLQRLLFSLSPRSEEIDDVLLENEEIISSNVLRQTKMYQDILRNIFGTPVARDFKGRDYQLR